MATVKKQTALVTGGAIRIGRAISLALATAGYDIALHYHSSEKDAFLVQAEIVALGVKCTLFQADLSDNLAAQSLVEQVDHGMGHLAVLVNSASVFYKGDFIETELEKLTAEFSLNFIAPFMLTKSFANTACKDNGQPVVINILDTRIEKNVTDHFVYTLSKKTLADFTRMAAKSLAPNVRVCGVAPGYILPPAGSETNQNDIVVKRRISDRIPMACQGKLSDVTAAVMYLVNNDFVTGEILFADGGENL